jgi:hypothetical protein
MPIPGRVDALSSNILHQFALLILIDPKSRDVSLGNFLSFTIFRWSFKAAGSHRVKATTVMRNWKGYIEVRLLVFLHIDGQMHFFLCLQLLYLLFDGL